MAWEWPNIAPEEPQYGDPLQEAATNEARARDLKFRLGGLAPGLVASVLNDPEAPGPLKKLPLAGAAAGQLSFGQNMLDMTQRFRDVIGDAGAGTPIEYAAKYILPLPRAEDRPDDTIVQRLNNQLYPTQLFNWADRVLHQTQQRGEEMVPHPAPETVADREALQWGENVAGLGLPVTKVLGPVGRAIESAAPSLVKGVLPGAFHSAVPVIAGGLGGGMEALTDAIREDDPQRPIITPPATPPERTDQLAMPGASSTGLTTTSPSPTGVGGASLNVIDIPPEKFNSGDAPPNFLNLGIGRTTVGDLIKDTGMVLMLAAGGKVASRLGANITKTARDARYEVESQKFNDAYTRKEPGPEAPLPSAGGVIHDKAVDMKTQWLDDNAQAKAYVDAVATAPDVARETKHLIGNVYNDGRYQNRVGEVLRTGVHDRTGITFPSAEQLFTHISQLPDVKRADFDTGSGYADELNNRVLLEKQMRANNTVNPALGPEQFYHNFTDKPTNVLQAEVARIFSDPELQSLRDRRKQINRGVLDVLEQDGFITPTVKSNLLATRPDYMSTSDENGALLHSFGERALSTGGGSDVRNTPVWELDKQHWSQLLRENELNRARNALVELGLDYQARNPRAAKVFTMETNMAGDPVISQEAGTIALRRPSGVVGVKVHNPDLKNWMTNSDAQMSAGLMADEYARTLYQKGTTGFWALADGRFYPPTNVIRTAVQMATNRNLPMAGGLNDAGVQRLTGGKFGSTLPDPTTPLGIGYSFGADVTGQLAHGLSYVFDYSAKNPINALVRATIGDNATNALSTYLRQKYIESNLSDRRSLGISGQGGAGSTPIATYQPGTPGRTYGQINNMVPRLFRNAGIDIPLLRTVGINGSWTIPTYIRMTRLATELFTLANDAGLSYMHRLNRNRPGVSREMLADEVADISGDPGVKGRGRIAQAMGRSLPYANVSAQGLRRQGEAFINNPVGSIGGVGTHLGLLALGSILSAYVMGPDHIRDLQEDTGLNRRASFPKFYTPYGPIEISLDQNLRGPYAIALDIAAALVGAHDAHRGEDAYKYGMGVLGDVFDHHFTTSSLKSAEHGFAQVADPFMQVPPWANAASVLLAGKELKPNAYSVAEGGSMSGGVGDQHFPPNYVPDAFLDSNTGKVGRSIVGALGGALTGVIDMLAAGEREARAGGGLTNTASAIGDSWWQQAKDNNPTFSGVFANNIRPLTTMNPINESVAQTLARMKETRGAWSAEKNESTTGRNGGPIAMGESRKVPTDPVMAQIYENVSREDEWINSHYMPAINSIKQQMGIADTKALPESVKRDMHNEYVKQLNEQYQFVYDRITDLNADLSRLTGRHVDVRSRIDWNGSPDQFHQSPGGQTEPLIAPDHVQH